MLQGFLYCYGENPPKFCMIFKGFFKSCIGSFQTLKGCTTTQVVLSRMAKMFY